MGAAALNHALALAPPKVRAHGLRDAHERPLVGRRKGERLYSWRTSPELAWAKPYLQIHAANSYAAIVVDCDDPEEATFAYSTGKLPPANWIVHSRTSGHHHAVWTLAVPVHRYPEAATGAIEVLPACRGVLHALGERRSGYSGVLTRNPIAHPDPDTVTSWGRRDPYHLHELARSSP